MSLQIRELIFFGWAYIFILLVGCTAQSSGESSSPSSGGSSESAGSEISVTFDMTRARALVLAKASNISSLQKLADNGEIKPAFVATSSGDSSSGSASTGGPFQVTVTQIFVAPTGEIYIEFTGLVHVNSQECYWVVVTQDDSASCMDVDG